VVVPLADLLARVADLAHHDVLADLGVADRIEPTARLRTQ